MKTIFLKSTKLFLLILLISYLYQVHIPYDEKELRQAPEVVKSLNYPTEFHEIYTKSGYMLQLLRIQKKNQTSIIDPYNEENKLKNETTQLKPILFLHGIFCDMNMYFAPEEDLIPPLIMANMGYDVWVANFRGTTKTQKHLNYTIEDDEFWDFDVLDFATEDLPTLMKFVGEFTNQKIDIVAFSMGGSMVHLALGSQEPTVEKYIGKVVAMCPGVHAWKIGLVDAIEVALNPQIAKYLGFKGFYYTPALYHVMHLLPDLGSAFTKWFSEGTGSYNYQKSQYQLAHFPSSVSFKVLEHLVQIKKARRLQKFDYGKEKNLEIYGQEEPEELDPKNIKKGEIHLLHGLQDKIIPVEDSEEFMQKAVNANIKLYKLPNHGHISFTCPEKEYSHLEIMVQIITENQDFRFKEN